MQFGWCVRRERIALHEHQPDESQDDRDYSDRKEELVHDDPNACTEKNSTLISLSVVKQWTAHQVSSR